MTRSSPRALEPRKALAVPQLALLDLDGTLVDTLPDIADCLNGEREDPSGWFVNSYPTFRKKRLLRFLFDHFQSDTLFNLMLGTKPMRRAASLVYFHHKGVFDPGERN